MKKGFSLIFMVMTLVLSSVSPAHAYAKAGIQCSKHKKVSVYAGKKYTCVKKGTKLVWNKGVPIAKPDTQEPSITLPLADQEIATVLGSTSTSIPVDTSETGNKVEDVKKLDKWEIAYNNVNSFILNKKSSTTLSPVISPNVDMSRIAKQEDLLRKSFSLWSSIYEPEKVTPWIFTGADKEWITSKIERRDILSDVTKHYFSNSSSCFFAGVWNTLENSYWLNKNEIYLCMGKGSEDFTFNHHLPHEYTHIVQGNVVKRKNIPQAYPLKCWMTEGVATFYGMAIGFGDNPHTQERNRLSFYRILMNEASNSTGVKVSSSLKSGEKEKIMSLVRLAENCEYGNSSAMGYFIGSLMTELLVSETGHESVLDFYKNSSYSQSWEKTFVDSFGMTFDSFCDKLVIYLKDFANGL